MLVVWWAWRTFGASWGAAAVVLVPVYTGTLFVFIDRFVETRRRYRVWRFGYKAAEVRERIATERADVVREVLA